MIISLQRGSNKAKFRIAWIRQVAPNERQAGVESLELQNNFWGVELYDPEREAKNEVRTHDHPIQLLKPCDVIS